MDVDVQHVVAASPETSTFTKGDKFFELVDHRGNVMATTSDKKKGHSSKSCQIIIPLGC